MYILEKGVYEKQIDSVRQKFSAQIQKNQSQKEKVLKKQAKLEDDEMENARETVQLQEYEDHFKSKLNELDKELNDLISLESQLTIVHQNVTEKLSGKKKAMEKQTIFKKEERTLQQKIDNLQSNKEFQLDQKRKFQS